MKATEIVHLLQTDPSLIEVTARGWVRSFRSNRFIALNDGSTINNMQCVVDFENFDENNPKADTLTFNSNSADSLILHFQNMGSVTDVYIYNESEFRKLRSEGQSTYKTEVKQVSADLMTDLNVNISDLEPGWYLIKYSACHIAAPMIRLRLQ